MTTTALARGATLGRTRHWASAHKSLRYRPGLDGIRAVAVLAVFVFHANPRWLPGGWLGVDVFFVLSGYLITTLLLTQRARLGRIDLTDFWLARARRLLPAVILVLLAVVTAGFFWTYAARRAALAGDALAAWFYAANWHFLLGDEAYFAAVASPSPLRHMWSLSVEEQFYLLYPLLLVLLLRLLGRTRRLALVLGALAVASALTMMLLHHPGIDPSRVYYGTDTRAQELLTGAVLASLLSPGSPISRPARIRIDDPSRRVALPALLALVACFTLVHETTPGVFEGGLLAFSVLTVLVVVAAASPNASPVQRLLSAQPLRRLGVISYGFYLWHWPVIVFLDAQRMHLHGLVLAVLQFAITLALSGLSYRFVEHPIRSRGLSGWWPRMPRLGLLSALAAAVLLAVLVALLPSSTRAVAGGTDGLQYAAPSYTPGAEQRRIMLLGNSIPFSLAASFPAATYPDLAVDQDTNFGCDMYDAPKVVDGQVQPTTQACRDWRASWPATVAAHRPDVALVFLTHPMLDDIEVNGRVLTAGSAEHTAYLRGQLDQMVASAKDSGSAHLAVMNLACHRMPNIVGTSELTRTNDDAAVGALNAMVADWGQGAGVPVLDQFGLLCTGGYHDTINGIPLYADGLHFSTESGAIFWSWLAPQLQAIAAGR